MIIGQYYIALFFCLMVCCLLNRAIAKNTAISLFVVLLVFFSGFRYNAGIDYFVYENMIFGSYELNYIEPFSRYLLLLARQYQAPWIFFLFTSVIYILTIVYGLKRTRVFGVLSIFIFTTFTLMYLSSFGFIRQYVAISIGFVSLIFLYEKKSVLFFIFAGTACLFHQTAIIILLLYPFRWIFFRQYHVGLHLALMLIAFLSTSILLKIVRLIPHFAHYVDYMLDGRFGVFGQKIFLSLVSVFVVISFFQRLSVRNNDKLLIYAQNMVSLGLIIYSSFLMFGEHFSRLGYYFLPFLIIWVVKVSDNLQKYSNKLLFFYFVFFVGVFYYFSTLYFAHGSSKQDFLNHYQFIWNVAHN